MSKRQPKDYEHLSCRLDRKAVNQLMEICNEVGLTKTKAVEKAIGKFYEEYKRTGRV